MRKNGFTLIELILVVAISSIVVLAITSFFQTSLGARAKNKTITEVEQQGSQIMSTILQTIVNAQAITSPTQGNSASSLTLDVVDAGSDPTIFDLSSGIVRVTEGVGSPINLSSSSVTVSGLNFSNLSKTDTPGTVRVEFTVAYNNPSGRQEFDWSKTFYGSASLR